MKYNQLITNRHKNPKRVGRGIASGQGKTAGRGTKGQMSRTGAKKRPGFEGGQNPLLQRLPKLRGFRSSNTKNDIVFLNQLTALKDKVIDNNALAKSGLVFSQFTEVKVLNRGDVNAKLNIKLQSISASALNVVQKNGGSFESIPRQGRVSKTTDNSIDK